MGNDVNELMEVVGGKRTIKVGEEEITLAPLEVGDIADASEFLLQIRANRFMKNPLCATMNDDVKGKAIAEIFGQKVSVFDLVDDRTGAIKLLELSMIRAGKKVSFDGVKTMLGQVDNAIWLPLLCDISGITTKREPVAEGDAPLPVSP